MIVALNHLCCCEIGLDVECFWSDEIANYH